jgi:hypothetical protein
VSWLHLLSLGGALVSTLLALSSAYIRLQHSLEDYRERRVIRRIKRRFAEQNRLP